MFLNIYNSPVKSSSHCNATRITRPLLTIFINFVLIYGIKQMQDVVLYLGMQVHQSILI